jgi:hypothetical protein
MARPHSVLINSLKAGDLIRDNDDGTLGLVLGPGYVSPVIRGVQTLSVQWATIDGPTEMDVVALEKGWVELVSTVDVPIV